MKIITTAIAMLINKVAMAGIFKNAQTNITIIGNAAHQLITKWLFNTLTVVLTFANALPSAAL